MHDVRVLAAAQLAISVIAPSLLPFVGLDVLVVLLAVSNALGGVAGLYGWKKEAEPSPPPL